MSARVLNRYLLADTSFWKGKPVQLPSFERKDVPVRSVCFSAGRMAFGHTGDILQDLLDRDPSVGLMAGIETFGARYCADLAACDYLLTQLIFGNEQGAVTAKIQAALEPVMYVDDNRQSVSWCRLLDLAADPAVQFGTINAPEGAYGMVYAGEGKAEPVSDKVKQDMVEGTVSSDAAKWTAFAARRYQAGLPFALVSCTNFSGNGHFTGAVVRAVAEEWERKGHAPKGFVSYLSDPQRFSFPNCMIDRIAVAPDQTTRKVMEELEIMSSVVVTEQTRYWVVEDAFPAGRPAFEQAEGVFMESSYEDVKKYEDMKLRILNMSHSVIAGLGVLLGYRGSYGIYRAMQDRHLATLINRIIDVVTRTIDPPAKMTPRSFADDSIARLNNPNIPDDPMRIALNGSTKMQPRFTDTYFAGQEKQLPADELDLVLLPVAGFLRYTLGVDDEGNEYELEGDPIKETLISCGAKAKLGSPESASVFRELIARPDIMGKDLFCYGESGNTLQQMVGSMLAGTGGVRKTLEKYLD